MEMIPIEIKSSSTFTKDFLKGINRFKKLTNNRCKKGYVLYNGKDSFHLDNIYTKYSHS